MTQSKCLEPLRPVSSALAAIRYLFKTDILVLMRYSILAVLVLLLCLPVANASFGYPTVEKYVDIYNDKVSGAPDILKNLLGNEKIDISVTMSNGSVLRVGLETDNGAISQVIKGEVENPTIVVVTTESAISAVTGSSDPISAFQKQMDMGQVRIEGENLVTRMKLNAVLSSTSVLKFFANIFFG